MCHTQGYSHSRQRGGTDLWQTIDIRTEETELLLQMAGPQLKGRYKKTNRNISLLQTNIKIPWKTRWITSHDLRASGYRNGFGSMDSEVETWMWIKNPTDATVCRYLFTAKLLYMFRVSQHPSSGVWKTVPAASGTGHTTCTATPLLRGLVWTSLYESSPD